MEYLILILVAVASFFVGRRTVKTFTPKQAEALAEIRVDARKALSSRTEERKQQILDLIKEKVEQQMDLAECSGIDVPKGIVRVDVEELLGVSNTTARRYLNALEEEGKIAQIGSTGRDVRYVLHL